MRPENLHAKIPPINGVLREGIRDIAHPFVFRHSTERTGNEGRNQFNQILKAGKGGIIDTAHYSAFDPAWIANEATKDAGLRNTQITIPIRWDRAYSGLSQVAKLGGINLVRVVTPAMYEAVMKKGNPHEFQKQQGFLKYITKAAETVKAGGIVIVASNPERQPEIQEDEYNVLGILVNTLVNAKNPHTEFGIHFTIPELKGVTDYSKHRSIPTALRRPNILHGGTLTGEQIWSQAMSQASQDGEDDPRKLKRMAIGKISEIAYHELVKFAPPGLKPATV